MHPYHMVASMCTVHSVWCTQRNHTQTLLFPSNESHLSLLILFSFCTTQCMSNEGFERGSLHVVSPFVRSVHSVCVCVRALHCVMCKFLVNLNLFGNFNFDLSFYECV